MKCLVVLFLLVMAMSAVACGGASSGSTSPATPIINDYRHKVTPQYLGGDPCPELSVPCPTSPIYFGGSSSGGGSTGTQTPLPIALCTMTSQTVASASPYPATRTTLGLAEAVNLGTNGDLWSVTGGGTLSDTTGSTTILTAPGTPGTTIVTASGPNCSGSRSIAFTVIAPSGTFYVRVGNIMHTKGLPDIGMQTWFYLQPATVSFQNLGYWEQAGTHVDTGVWSCLGNHTPSPTPQDVGAVVPGIGSEVLSFDTAYFPGPCPGYPAPYVASTATQYIPNVYAVAYNAGTDSAYYGPTSAPFVTITQAAALSSAGALSMQKGNATAPPTTVNSPTSTFPPGTMP